MGTEVHCKSYLPGYYSMGDLNEDSNSSSWPLFYGDKTLTNGQYYNGFMPTTVADAYPGYDKDLLKQKMLEHEAIFRNQVYELHRLYRIQRDMMKEIEKKELHKQRTLIETSPSSNYFASQIPSEDARKWHVPTFPLTNSGYARPSMPDVEIINSPLSSTRGKSMQAGRLPSQNGCISKDCEILESRPPKVRKKLFDLQVPADEYIDTEEGEQFRDTKISPENSVKFFLGGNGKTDRHGDGSTPDSCLRGSFRLADLNEPVQVEETTVPTSVDFLGRYARHVEIRGPDLSAKPKSEFRGLCNETLQKSQFGGNNGTLSNLSVENKGKGREWISYMYEAGQSKSNLNSVHQGPQQDKLPVAFHPTQVMLNKAHQPLGVFPTNHTREDLWRERTGRGLEISDRSRDYSNYNYPKPVVASHTPSPYPFVNSSDFANSLSHSLSSWGKPTSSLTQKLTTVHTHPSLNSSATLSRSSQLCAPSHDICGEKWHANGASRSTLGLGNDQAIQNGFYQGSSSGSKEPLVCFPSIGFDYQNGNWGENLGSERTINHGSEKYFKGSNFMDLNSAKDLNSSVVVKSSCNETVSKKNLEIIDEKRKCEDHLAVLPWLRAKAKPACKNEDTDTRRDSISVDFGFFQASPNNGGTVKDLNEDFTQNDISASSERDIVVKEIGDSPSNRKILGFPIFEKPRASKNESPSLVSTSSSLLCPADGENIKNEGKNRIIDINLACDPSLPESDSDEQIAAEPLVVERAMDTKVNRFRNHIDLNSYMTEDEDPVAPPVASTSSIAKIILEIDLEAPVVPETLEDEEVPPVVPETLEDEEVHPVVPETLEDEEVPPVVPETLEDEKVPPVVHETLEDVKVPKQCEATFQSQHKAEESQNEIVRIAAEAIVAMSSSADNHHMEDVPCKASEASTSDSFLWFVEVVSSYADDLENKLGKESRGKDVGDIEDSSKDEIDYFEAMTLLLPETKEEDYMPKPFVPEFQEVEETGGTSLPSRTRKGQARRGRQRRDFQRDILPGLVSLSRHEVTEDLQTFGGLMKATGHTWNWGLTRRNGGGRGRRRSVVDTAPSAAAKPLCAPLMQRLNNVEAGLEERSLTGWGKTTRRPRRQRCPAGNSPSIPLT